MYLSMRKSPNFDSGRSGHKPEAIVLHKTEENDTAWHAGVIVKSSWKGLKIGVNPNLYTIGIELAGYAVDDTPADQAIALAELIVEIHQRWKIPLDEEHIIFHREIRANKTCPGFKLSKKLIIFYAKTILWQDQHATA